MLNGELSKGSKERGRLESKIAGSLKSCISAHGPITKKWVGSAAKRAVAEFLAWVKEEQEKNGRS